MRGQRGRRRDRLERRARGLQQVHSEPGVRLDRPGAGGQHDHAAVAGAERGGRRLLHRHPQGGGDVARGATGMLREDADRAGRLRHGPEAHPRRAGQQRVERLLEAALAVRLRCRPSRPHPLGDCRPRRRLHIPGDDRKRRSLRVRAVGGRALGEHLALAVEDASAHLRGVHVPDEALTRLEPRERERARPLDPLPPGHARHRQRHVLLHAPEQPGRDRHDHRNRAMVAAGRPGGVQAAHACDCGGVLVEGDEARVGDTRLRLGCDLGVHAAVVAGVPGGHEARHRRDRVGRRRALGRPGGPGEHGRHAAHRAPDDEQHADPQCPHLLPPPR